MSWESSVGDIPNSGEDVFIKWFIVRKLGHLMLVGTYYQILFFCRFFLLAIHFLDQMFISNFLLKYHMLIGLMCVCVFHIDFLSHSL